MTMPVSFQFPSELTIYEVADTHNELKQYLSSHDVVAFNLSQITEIDSAGLQLALWMLDHCVKHNKQVTDVAQSELVKTKFDMLGVCLLVLADSGGSECL